MVFREIILQFKEGMLAMNVLNEKKIERLTLTIWE